MTIFPETPSVTSTSRGTFKRIEFDDKTDWRAVIHAIQGALCKTQAQMAVEAGVSQAAVSDLYKRASKAPRFHLGRTLERLYDSIPCEVLRTLPPVPALARRIAYVGDMTAARVASMRRVALGVRSKSPDQDP